MAQKSASSIGFEREVVLRVIRESAQPITYADMRVTYLEYCGSPIAYSTLRVRLSELERIGLVRSSGARRSPRYFAVPDEELTARHDELARAATKVGATGNAAPAAAEPDVHVPLADDALRARAFVRTHRALRPSVSHNDDFLKAYRPGQSHYLSPALRDHLRDLGRTAYVGQAPGSCASHIRQQLIVSLTWGSGMLAGSRLSESEVAELLTNGPNVDGRDLRDLQQLLNHKAAIEFLVDQAPNNGFDRATIISLHALLSENLIDSPDDEGRLRARATVVGDSQYAPLSAPLMDDAFSLFLSTANDIADPIERAFFALVHLPYAHPFVAANGRTARLLANVALAHANLCPLTFAEVPVELYRESMLAVYELTDVALLRDVFTWGYERSCGQFQALRDAVGQPDRMRLVYRLQLRTIVAEVVNDLMWPGDAELQARAARLAVAPADIASFVAAARRDLLGLRPEILARYPLQPAQFKRWSDRVGAARPSRSS